MKEYMEKYEDSLKKVNVLKEKSNLAIWHTIFNENNFIIKWISSGLFKLGENGLYKFPILMFFIWENTGFNLILFLAGLMNIPKEIYEACEVEGASWFRKHIHITFPLLLPTTFFAIIISTVNSFKIFKEVYLLYVYIIVAFGYKNIEIYRLLETRGFKKLL